MCQVSLSGVTLLLELFLIGQLQALLCPRVVVYNADYADCNGEYDVTQETVSWAPDRRVYAHQSKDRYIFWNAGGLGWSIGKREYLKSGTHWHKSGSDDTEPWTSAWLGGVVVKCAEKSGSCCNNIEISSTGEARRDQTLYMGVYARIKEDYNGRPVYVKQGQEELYVYYFTSQKHGISLWVIGPKVGEFRAGIRNSSPGSCVHDLEKGWKYASRSGVWSDSDPTLTVKCHDFNQESNFESKRISPRPKALDIDSHNSIGDFSEKERSFNTGRQKKRATNNYCNEEKNFRPRLCLVKMGNMERVYKVL